MKRSAIIVLLLLGLAGAGPGVSGVRAEDLTVALSSLSTETLDPVLGGHIVKFYLDQIFDYLVGVTPDGQLSADDGIATRWESSPDNKRWTFHLRRGVRFHNGDELTSDDVKWSLQRAMGKRSTTGYAERDASRGRDRQHGGQPRAGEGAAAGGRTDRHEASGRSRRLLVDPAVDQRADPRQARARGAEHRDRPPGADRVGVRRDGGA